MRSMCLLGLIFFIVNITVIFADEVQTLQDTTESPGDSVQSIIPRFRGRAVVLEINARIIEQNREEEPWNESHRKTTISGRPVGIKIVGANVVIAAQFTPYTRRGVDKFLVAQGQIWMDVPNEGIRYHASVQTIPVEYGEPIYFFPLGSFSEDSSASIEVVLTLFPYEEH